MSSVVLKKFREIRLVLCLSLSKYAFNVVIHMIDFFRTFEIKLQYFMGDYEETAGRACKVSQVIVVIEMC